MQTKAKANSIITHEIDAANNTLVFKVKGAGDIRFDLNKVNDDLTRRAMAHGFIQRISDAAAIPFNKEENRYATPQEKYEAMRALVEHYESGTAEWSRKGGSGGPRTDGEGVLILRALAEVYSHSLDEQREIVKNVVAKRVAGPRNEADKTMTQKAYLAGVLATSRAANGVGPMAKIAEAYDRLKAAQPVSVAAIDPDEALNELAGPGGE